MMNINFHKELDSFLNMGSNIPNDSWLISRIRDDDGHMTFVWLLNSNFMAIPHFQTHKNRFALEAA